ncbi:PAS domain S-box protein [Pacificimonas sp. WHA3]|uniref:histidine kinase n=1 Tax=Pacificimonas pallii TaxID=2827236 RepID=A0ABS6SDW6_9SPHN|nr:ATP-binding protein [Pacificimonas pallii]MBV7256603.1 PAS domain S-box protein [Pacificimonas pallii]
MSRSAHVPNRPADELARHELLLKALLTLSPDVVITINRHGIIQSLGQAVQTMFGYAHDELVGQNVAILMPSPDREQHDGYIERFLTTGEPRIIGIGRQVRGRRKDGELFPLFLRVAEVWDGGEPMFLGMLHDLTEEEALKSREQELRAAMQHMSRVASLGELAAEISHELNQPLTAITQYLSALNASLAMDAPDLAGIGALARKANAQAQRAGDVVRSMRRFVKTETGRREACDVARLLSESVDLSLLDREMERIDVRFDLPADLPPVLCEPVQVQQVVHNLLRNAVEAMHETSEPVIRLKARATGKSRIEIVVEDNGAGIAPNMRDQLFERFRTGRRDGLGIGLAICRSIVTAHGGQIEAEDALGGGTCFRFTLPAADRP